MTDMALLIELWEFQLDRKDSSILPSFTHKVKALTALKTTIEVHKPIFAIKGTRAITQIKKIADA